VRVAPEGGNVQVRAITRERLRVVTSAITVTALVSLLGCGPSTGDHLADFDGSYGATALYEVGDVFAEAVTYIEVVRGPITLISAKPVLHDPDGVVRYLGVMARTPDTTTDGTVYYTATVSDGWPMRDRHQTDDLYPPPDRVPRTNSAAPLAGFQVPSRDSNGPDLPEVNLLFGYEVLKAGTAERRGVEVVYEYEGTRYRAFIPSYFTVCAPRGVECDPS
jgi:hypothetical protein